MTEASTTETKKPSHIAKARRGTGKEARYDHIGAAFENDDGSFFVKMAGQQIVTDFTLYPRDTIAE